MKLLDLIHQPNDIKKISDEQLPALCEEIREFLIQSVSETGGHLASNLGVVELTIALHKSFQLPQDKIIFDVGHQSYVHKILTGRKEQFSTLRQYKGLSGFPKTYESEYDTLNTGHSSNSISVALGIRRAFDLTGNKSKVVALIGDGALSGGMAYEALNDAGQGRDNVIVVLNDNQMSISKNTTGISNYLSKIRTTIRYLDAKNSIENMFKNTPKLKKLIHNTKNVLKHVLVSGAIFEELGFSYYGPYDGHNISELCDVFQAVKHIEHPVLIHVITKKGKGYLPAEIAPEKYHGVPAFDSSCGIAKTKKKNYSSVFGEKLCALAQQNSRITAITASMPDGTGLSAFAALYPERFYDVGIAEEHAVSLATGLALGGCIPVFAVYSSFLQRGYDQVLTDVALMNTHVVFCVDRAGLVGEDGETHQGIFDLSYLSHIPNLTILSPASFQELEMMLEYAVQYMNSPTAIRYPRGGEGAVLPKCPPIETGKSVVLLDGEDAVIVAEGRMVSIALETAYRLRQENIYSAVINVRSIKPLDVDLMQMYARSTGRMVVIEENVKSGGLGQSVLDCIKDIPNTKLLLKCIPDAFIEHGCVSELHKVCGLDSESVFSEMKEVLFA